MAEKTMLVCDVCGEVAETSVTLRVDGRTMVKDLCATHLAELVRGTRKPKRGRPKSTAGRTATTTRKRATTRAKSPRGRRAAGTRRGRRPSTPAGAMEQPTSS